HVRNHAVLQPDLTKWHAKGVLVGRDGHRSFVPSVAFQHVFQVEAREVVNIDHDKITINGTYAAGANRPQGRFFDYYVQPRTKTAGQSLTTSFDKVPQGTLGFGDRYMKVTKTASKQPYDIALQHWYAQNRNQCLVLRSTRDAHS